MSQTTRVKSPLGLRLLIWAGSVFFTFLLYWFLGFVLDDVGRFAPVDREAIEERHVGRDLLDRRGQIANRVEAIRREIESEKERQSFYRDQSNTARGTMQQMTDLQKKSMELGEPRDTEQEQAVARAQKAFLESQDRYNAQAEIALKKGQDLRAAQDTLRELDKQIETKRGAAREEYRRAALRRDMLAAALRILILLPAIVFAFYLFLRKRSGGFAPLVYAVDVAVLWKLVRVIHAHFPKEYYKYVFIVAAILAVWRVLVLLLRAAAKAWRGKAE